MSTSVDDLGVGDDVRRAARPRVLARLVGVEPHRDLALGRHRDELAHRGVGLRRPRVREDGDRARRRSCRGLQRGRARDRASAPARPASARWTKVSRLPFGPARPEARSRCTARAAARAARTRRPARPRRARSARSRTTPPLPTSARPTSNCGLTIASASKRGAQQREDRGQDLVSEMNETSAVTRSGRVTAARSAVRARALTRSSDRDALVAAQRPLELAVGDVERDTCAAPRWSRQSVKPPVDAPTSRQRAAGDVDARARRARSRA